MKTVNFRVDDAEHVLMHAIAGATGLNLSTYIRQHFRAIAIEKGLMQNPLDELRAPSKPAAPTTSVAGLDFNDDGSLA